MAKKDIFKDAIATAKQVREAALVNAKASLEENLSPHLKDLISAKLQEMEESEEELAEENVEESTEETVEESAEEEVNEMEDGTDGEEEIEGELDSELDSAESEEAPEEEELDIEDMEVEDLKALIKDLIVQVDAEQEEIGDELDTDLEAGTGEEEVEDELDAEEEELDIDEIMAELEEMEAGVREGESSEEEEVMEGEEVQMAAKDRDPKDLFKENNTLRKRLKEATSTVTKLTEDLEEINVLNSKLLYLNKIFKSTNLSESQKVNLIKTFDKVETAKEAKLVFETVSDNLKDSKKVAKGSVQEGVRGSASKAAGATPKKKEVIAENSQWARMQQLAGITKED